MTVDAGPPPSPPDRPAWSVLVEAIENLSAARTLDRVIEIVRDAARRISGADGVTFVLRDGDRCHYVDENAIGPLWKGQKFPLSACISGWAMLNRQTAVIPDIYADPRIPHDAYRPTFVESLVMVPVRIEDPLAAIGAYWARSYQPNRGEIALLESLARATSTSLANISLEASLRDAAQKAVAQAAEISLAYDEAQRETARRLQAEEQLRQSQKLEAIGQMTGGMAHDFNNLLGVIIGNLDMLVEVRGTDAEVKTFAEPALDAALRGADLVRRLLAFARRQPLRPQRVDLNEHIRKFAALMRRTLGEHIEIVLDLPDGTWPVVLDPAQLETSLANLATNARDAMPNGGRLRIRTANSRLDADYVAVNPDVAIGDYAMIEVSDTGTGIPRGLIERIFEPFFTTKELGKGTGLGLSMVFGFVKQSGGHVTVDSEEGRGTTFRLYLPRTVEDAARDRAKAPDPIMAGKGEVILVAEDNADVRKIAAQQLIDLGYRVLEASDVASALIVLEEERVDLLLTDVIMPGGRSGHDLIRDALARWPSLRIVLTSGFPDAMIRDETETRQLKVLSKPYRKAELARTMRAALDA